VIAALRRRHLVAWSVLALAAPALLISALSLRAGRPADVAPQLPEAFADRGDGPAARQLAHAPLFAGLPLHVLVRPAAGRTGALTLDVQPEESLLEPDVLVYVLPRRGPDAAPDDGALPAEARLLGALSGTLPRRWVLPAGAAELLLYSLGHQRVLARGPLPAAGAGGSGAAR